MGGNWSSQVKPAFPSLGNNESVSLFVQTPSIYRKLAEISIVIGQAESSARNRTEKHLRSSETGVFQQNELFGQRDAKGFQTKKLSKETRLDIKDCNDRIYRILNKEQQGDENWRNGDIGERCRSVLPKPTIHDIQLISRNPVVANYERSKAFKGGPDVQIGRPYTGPLDRHSVVDAFKAQGLDSSFENRARVGQQLGVQGTPGSAEFNTALLRRLS
ncbi:hypothetical protein GQ44DRAFT_727957 [Phaeosphaeriaceae sp. PMI808]|nr:hypothetical protein GQ44DRAFT_727957 [Phaeosphaeriaceae sp. PMI808]